MLHLFGTMSSMSALWGELQYAAQQAILMALLSVAHHDTALTSTLLTMQASAAWNC